MTLLAARNSRPRAEYLSDSGIHVPGVAMALILATVLITMTACPFTTRSGMSSS